jgi:hypothetical protein
MATEIIKLNTQNLTTQTYNELDSSLLPSYGIDTLFTTSSYIECFIYDINNKLLSENYSFNYFSLANNPLFSGDDNLLSQIQIDPEKTLLNEGYNQGEYVTYFNFLNKQIGSYLENLFITEISSDRTEIRLSSTYLSSFDLIEQANNFINERETNEYFIDFYVNFKSNKLYIANNIALDTQDPLNPTILIKLYNALPSEFDINSPLWVVTSLDDPCIYQVKFEDSILTFSDTIKIKGPNFNLNFKDQVNNSSLELSYSDLITSPLTSSFNQIKGLINKKEIDINVDYTDFSNFTHFSSVKSRTENFIYKINLIEQYSSSIALINSQITGSTSSSIVVNNNKNIYEDKISSIISNFDGYDYYLYYSSESLAYPKSNSLSPYNLYPSTSSIVLTWLGSDDESNPYYGGILLSASIYDNDNQNNLYFSIPEYLREDPLNDQYLLFVEMVGQHYDNIWIYYKDVTQKYNADNRLENGISKDIVADAIRDFGIKLYQNNFSNEDLYTAFLGLTPDGGLFPFPNITGSLPTPSGYEYINTKISASNNNLPLDDVNKSLYKRIYHNLPYLLQTKGTLPGLRALITSYGIPDTILRINEYGGKDKTNTNDWDYWQNEFNYAYEQNGDNFISSSFYLNSSWGGSQIPETLMFRFKTNVLPTSSIPYSQSLSTISSILLGPTSHITLRYTGSAYTSGSYNGSIIDPYYQYAYLDFYPYYSIQPTLSASIYLPFFNGDWWSVMVKKTGTGASTNFELFSGNKMYDSGENGTSISFLASSSVITNDGGWNNSDKIVFGSGSSTINAKIYNNFSGSFQEIRYYTKPISESVFRDFVMNPSSIEGNSINSGADQLAFRLPLGGELYTGSKSIHPKVTGSWIFTSSFLSDSTAFFNSTPTFVSNTEYFYYDQPVVGIKNAIADKIRVENNVIPEGDVLSPFMSLSQQANISQSYTANTNLLEVAFSPQDEVNDDINSSLGYFNIGEYIGDPRLRSSSAEFYPDLNALRDSYFQKYTKNYNLVDFVRLIKFFDNSLFKMIKDFVPARTSLASGIVIKQHILERNKVPQPQVDTNSNIAYYASGSTNNQPLTFQDISVSGTIAPQWNDYNAGTVENFDGGTAGVFEMFNGTAFASSGSNIFNLTQSWSELIQNASGSVNVIHNSQDEFYNGEFDGSVLTVTTQSLHAPFPNDSIDFSYTPVRYSPQNYGLASSNPFAQYQFLNALTVPAQGEILLLRAFRILLPDGSTGLSSPYVKIHKFDNNGFNNDIALGQATKLRIKHTTLPDYVTIGNVVSRTEYPTYWLYKVNLLGSDIADNYILDYSVSCSVTSSYSVGNGTPKTIINWNSSLPGTNLPHYGTPYFNTSSGIFTFENTSNIQLTLTASINTTGNGITSNFIQLIQIRNQTETVLSTSIYNSGGTNVLTTITSSLYPLLGDQYYIQLTKAALGVGITVNSAQLLLTQSISPTASVSCSVIIEPYLSEPNFYNSDNNALLNSISDQRENSFALDVDYTYGTTPPINFGLLISGTATHATVPDSNYTSKKSTLLKYDGSKSTSQLLNTWTQGDTGTYGKLPTVESLKTYIAYCDGINGWPPEHENASAMNVIYLIKADGTVVIPNTSKDSLSIMQQIFQTGERVIINTKNVNISPLDPYRTVIRGGSHIEPILYTQFGQLPNVTWNTTMSFEDIVLAPNGNVENYAALYGKTYGVQTLTFGAPQQVTFNQTIYGIAVTSNSYTIPAGSISDGVQFNIDASINLLLRNVNEDYDWQYLVTLYIYKNSTSIFSTTPLEFNLSPNNEQYTTISSSQVTLPAGTFNTGDTISVYIKVDNYEGYPSGATISSNNTSFNISQYPVFTQPITSSGVNSIWNWPNSSSYPYIITSSNSALAELYGNPNVKAKDITGSGFNTIQLPWKINYGDEFKFEGREDFTYMVKNIFGPAESGSGRVFETGSIEVHFNANLPVSASSSVFNLDHFLIRRYVDDAAQNVITGFRPPNSEGPYIVKPEFVVPELNKSIDEVILDLTQKGLII